MTRPTDLLSDPETAARRAVALEAFDLARRSLDAVARDALSSALDPPAVLDRLVAALRDLEELLPEDEGAVDSIARIVPRLETLPPSRVAAAASLLATGTQSWTWAPMIEPAIESLAAEVAA